MIINNCRWAGLTRQTEGGVNRVARILQQKIVATTTNPRRRRRWRVGVGRLFRPRCTVAYRARRIRLVSARWRGGRCSCKNFKMNQIRRRIHCNQKMANAFPWMGLFLCAYNITILMTVITLSVSQLCRAGRDLLPPHHQMGVGWVRVTRRKCVRV
jgi:hypothetical protein